LFAKVVAIEKEEGKKRGPETAATLTNQKKIRSEVRAALLARAEDSKEQNS
jgi:hypothetical protein